MSLSISMTCHILSVRLSLKLLEAWRTLSAERIQLPIRESPKSIIIQLLVHVRPPGLHDMLKSLALRLRVAWRLSSQRMNGD